MYSLVGIMAEKFTVDDNVDNTLSPAKPIAEPVIKVHIEEKARYLCRVNKHEGKYRGYRIDILTENLSERDKVGFICSVCEGILKEACVSSSGEQFCSCCRNISNGKETSNVPVRKMINTLKCSCPLIERGCKWLGTLEDCEKHLDTCGYVYVSCKLKCDVVLRRNELEKHEKETCPQRVVKCDHCEKDFKSCRLIKHLNKCAKMKVPCDLCDTQITREDMPQHLKHDCDMVQEACKLGCGVTQTRNELKIHEKDTCLQRVVKCDHCKKGFKSCELNEHQNKCPMMKVPCDLCDTQITREDMPQHLKYDCDMVQEACQLGCGVTQTRNELKIHEKDTCFQRAVKCDHCKKDFKSCELIKHLNNCAKMKVPCDLCDTQITREDMPQHLKHDCDMVQETCQLGCGVKLTRNELTIHEKDTCVQRKIACEHCNISLKFCDYSRHLEECPYMEVTCDLCSEGKYRQDMTEHLKYYCPEKMLECPFVKYKCLTVMKRKDMDNHLEEKETKHLGLKLSAMEDLITKQNEKISKQNGEITKQSDEIIKQSDEISKQSKEIIKQSGEIIKQSKEIQKLNENIEKQNIAVYTQNEEIKKLKEENEKQNTEIGGEKRYINLLCSMNDITTLIWKIESVTGLIRRGYHYSVSNQYLVAGCSCNFKILDNRELSIVFPGTTRKYVNPFIAKCRIALDSRNIIDCGKIEVKQTDLTRGCERTLTTISQENVDKYSKPNYHDDTQEIITLYIYLSMQ